MTYTKKKLNGRTYDQDADNNSNNHVILKRHSRFIVAISRLCIVNLFSDGAYELEPTFVLEFKKMYAWILYQSIYQWI